MNIVKARGFTLIELVVVVVIISILVTVALPNYRQQLVKTRRSEAQSALLALANALERRFTVNSPSTYEGAADDGNGGAVNTGAPLSSLFPSQAPINGDKKFYNLSITSASNVIFIIRAVPIAGTDQADDGYLELHSNGARVWDKNNDGSDLVSW